MERADLDGAGVEYEKRGDGDTVVLVHHGVGADWFSPLLEERGLVGRFQLLRYHRPGYAGRGPLPAPLTFANEARTFRALMQHLSIPRAHLVGHSASACITLQIALDVPECVHSLVLLEPALLAVPSPPEVPQAIALYHAGHKTAAVETFLRGTCGPDSRSVLDTVLPGAIDRALADADVFFGEELPALRGWTFGPDEASRIMQPVLAVLGEQSDVRFHQRHQLLLDWLPNVEPFVLPGAGHLLHLQNRGGFAEGLTAFLLRHPIGPAT